MQELTELEQLDSKMKEKKEAVEFAEAIERLRKNRDFKKVVENGYFKEEPSRLVLSLANVNMQGEEVQTAIKKAIEGIGTFHNYLHFNLMQGRSAITSLREDEKTRMELLSEEDGE